MQEGKTSVFLCEHEKYWPFELRDWDFKVLILNEIANVQTVIRPDIIFENKQKKIQGFEPLLTLQTKRDSGIALWKNGGCMTQSNC